MRPQAYNMIAQRDSRTMTELGNAARFDSRAMRTIAVVTMAFLPPTFLSVRHLCSHARVLLMFVAGDLQHELLQLSASRRGRWWRMESVQQVLGVFRIRDTTDVLHAGGLVLATAAEKQPVKSKDRSLTDGPLVAVLSALVWGAVAFS